MTSTTTNPARIAANSESYPRGLAPWVSALYHYPIKSCAGTQVDALDLVETGPLHDRELMVVNAATHAFLTQRQLPRLALIAPSICENRVVAEAPGMPRLDAEILVEDIHHEVTIWKDHVDSVDQGDIAATWFSQFLGEDVRLVRKAPSFIRRIDPDYATAGDDQVGFADGYPLLVISEESLADLNGRLADPLPMNRFRPNIVITGCPHPYFEDTLTRFSIGDITLHAIKRCARCKITTVDQDTGETGKEPLSTLATYRKSPKGVVFGMNLIHKGHGKVAVGDHITVPNPDNSC